MAEATPKLVCKHCKNQITLDQASKAFASDTFKKNREELEGALDAAVKKYGAERKKGKPADVAGKDLEKAEKAYLEWKSEIAALLAESGFKCPGCSKPFAPVMDVTKIITEKDIEILKEEMEQA